MRDRATRLRSRVATWRDDLRLRIMAVALLPLLLAVGLLAGYFVHRQIDTAWQALEESGDALAQRLADAAVFDMFAGNKTQLQRLVDYEIASHGHPAIGIVDMTGKWWLVGGDPTRLPGAGDVHGLHGWRSGAHYYFVRPIRHRNPLSDDPYLSDGQAAADTLLGHVVVVLGTASVEQAGLRVATVSLAVAVVLLCAAGWLAWRLSQWLSAPLNAVIGTVRNIAQGDLGSRVPEVSTGEPGELERGVNHMATVIEQHGQDMLRRVEEATADLRAQKQAAEAAVLARSRFLAAASHDLRQPMHALTLLAEALKEKLVTGDTESRRLTDNIAASAYAMQSLLNALLDLSRLDAGVVVARPECVAVTPLLRRLADQFAGPTQEKGLTLRVHASVWGVYADPLLLERILGNLIANAIRYTERGGILIGLRCEKPEFVRIEVRDTGKGIPATYRERIFEEYFQLDNPERGRDKGLGLGLTIVQRLARLLGASVSVRSTLGKGSCFGIRLPRCGLTGALPASEPGGLPVMVTPASGQRRLVVFIDDDESILEAMTSLFEMWGIDLAVGIDARQVITDLLELGRIPEAILSDYRLKEGGTGVEAVRALREVFGQPIPATLITGDTAPETLRLIETSGLPVLFKPLKPASLRAMLHHMLNQAAAIAPGRDGV